MKSYDPMAAQPQLAIVAAGEAEPHRTEGGKAASHNTWRRVR